MRGGVLFIAAGDAGAARTAAFDAARTDGRASLVTEGEFVDAPIAERCRRRLEA